MKLNEKGQGLVEYFLLLVGFLVAAGFTYEQAMELIEWVLCTFFGICTP